MKIEIVNEGMPLLMYAQFPRGLLLTIVTRIKAFDSVLQKQVGIVANGSSLCA